MRIQQFKYGSDNLSYLIYGEKSALAIDGGAVEDILAFVRGHGLELLYITNTHAHADHTSGNHALLERSDARMLDHTDLAQKGQICLEDELLRVYTTPGDTMDSVVCHRDN